MAPRIAYLLKKFPRLSETFVLNELLGLERMGRPLHVFSRRTPDDEPRHPQLAQLSAPVEMLPSIRELDPWSGLFGRGGSRLATRLRSVVGSWDGWDHPRRGSLLSEALHLVDRTKALGIEHLHVHFASDAAVVAMMARDLGGPTYSLTAHAKDIYRNGAHPSLMDRMFEMSEFVVTVCQANIRHLERQLSDSALSRVRLLYNGIDLDRFGVDEPFVGRRDPMHVLFVGRLVEKKGCDILLEALARLRRQGVSLGATVVGDGELRGWLKSRVDALDLSGRVAMTGGLDQSRVRELMARATVFCLPCRIGGDGNRDALPTVLIEALASGLPVISTPVTGIPEILGNGEAGVLVPENDPDATAEAILRLVSEPTTRRRLAVAGRRRAERLFDVERSTATLDSWFDEVLTRGTQPCASCA